MKTFLRIILFPVIFPVFLIVTYFSEKKLTNTSKERYKSENNNIKSKITEKEYRLLVWANYIKSPSSTPTPEQYEKAILIEEYSVDFIKKASEESTFFAYLKSKGVDTKYNL